MWEGVWGYFWLHETAEKIVNSINNLVVPCQQLPFDRLNNHQQNMIITISISGFLFFYLEISWLWETTSRDLPHLNHSAKYRSNYWVCVCATTVALTTLTHFGAVGRNQIGGTIFLDAPQEIAEEALKGTGHGPLRRGKLALNSKFRDWQTPGPNTEERTRLPALAKLTAKDDV